MVFPDDASLQDDRSKGYFLAASFAKVTAITGLDVHVKWLFAERYSSKLRSFSLDHGVEYVGIIHESDIFTGDTESCVPLKAVLDRANRLKQITKDAIKDVIGIEEFNKYN